ncbi:MAG: methionyl-tRNA formyltransferase [Patescibacteria group bacterium]
MNSSPKCNPKIIFYGTPDFGAFIFDSLIKAGFDIVACITQADKPQGRKKEVITCPVKRIAQDNGILVLQPTSLNDTNLINKIIELKPDLAVVASYGKIIPQKLLNIPAKGNLNVHGSLLPKLRGASPIATAILHGLKETGVTIMLMNAQMDEGPILSQKNIIIQPEDTSQTLEEKMKIFGSTLLIETICPFLAGKIQAIDQDKSQPSYTMIITKEDGLIDWQKSAVEINNQIRAYIPWPSSFTRWQGKQIKIVEAVVLADAREPGLVFLHNDEMAIGTTDQSLIIKKIQLEGKRVMLSADFLKGYQDIIGDSLPS